KPHAHKTSMGHPQRPTVKQKRERLAAPSAGGLKTRPYESETAKGTGSQNEQRDRRPPDLHLITAQVFVVQVFEPAPQFLVGGFLGRSARDFRSLEYFLFDENGAIEPKREREGIAGPRIERHGLAFA